MRITLPTKNVVLTAWALFIDGPTGNGTIELYSGSPAVSVGAAPSGTKIATQTFGRPAFQTPSGGNLDAYPITSETNATSGTIGCFIIKNSSGTICGDGTVTLTGDGGDLEFDEVDADDGDTIAMSSLRVNLG
jgi:hypothetical protein